MKRNAEFWLEKIKMPCFPTQVYQPLKFCESKLRTPGTKSKSGPIAWGSASQITWVKMQILIQCVHPDSLYF